MESIRTLIIDDEPAARRGIRQHLRAYPEAEIVGECAHGQEAVERIPERQPDLVFLDVQMPELGGFEVIEHIGIEAMPVVIFVTAYDEYALKAFEVHALDYLLKPIDAERFQDAFQRAVRHIRRNSTTDLNQRVRDVLRYVERQEQQTFLDRLVIKEGGRIFFLDVQEIDWIEAAGNYVKLHTGQDAHLLRATMTAMTQKLNPRHFIRISRSAIINVGAVNEFQPRSKGSYDIILQDGTELTSSRHYRENIDALFEEAS